MIPDRIIMFWSGLQTVIPAAIVYLIVCVHSHDGWPIVLNTWAFDKACQKAWEELASGQNAVESIVAGCSMCELKVHCDTSVGYGGSPDEAGETTLDAMIMDGETMDVGSVGCLRRVKNAIGVAYAVMKYTKHTLLVGDLATKFAKSVGFTEESLQTNVSQQMFIEWKQKSCQPNFRQNMSPDPTKHCGPYKPITEEKDIIWSKPTFSQRFSKHISQYNHDTIGMLAIDAKGHIASGTSTNGASHKVPGRVGDSPVAGAGSYALKHVGAAAATGDGDVMMRFLPSLQAVQLMAQGLNPAGAAQTAINTVQEFYPDFAGAIIALNITGHYGAACHNIHPTFPFSIAEPSTQKTVVKHIPCSIS